MTNTLIIMSDEHSRKVMGAYGNPHVPTPHLDALAARGTLFENAYCNSPICVPSRASFHTGLYPHQIRYWDNAMPYDGRVPSFGHALQAAGRPVVSIGKLHFRDADAPTGFDAQIMPLHVHDGIGDPSTLLRRNPPPRPGTRRLSQMVGEGVTPYWDYDVAVTAAAETFLSAPPPEPWTAFVSLVLPHFPLNAPPHLRARIDAAALALPKARGEAPPTPTTAAMRALLDFDDHFAGEDHVREALAHYYALVAGLDDNVGRILAALEGSGAAGDTLVIYASDHGDNLGARGFWGKSTLWEEAAGVPLVLAGPGVPEGRRAATPVSLVDLYPTILDAAGLDADPTRPGTSLLRLAGDSQPDRTVFAEYHAVGAVTGMFMVRSGRYKLIEAVGDRPLLYDLQTDPEELCDLADDAGHEAVLEDLRGRLAAILDIDRANAQAFADQAALIAHLGGEDAVRGFTPIAFTDPREGPGR